MTIRSLKISGCPKNLDSTCFSSVESSYRTLRKRGLKERKIQVMMVLLRTQDYTVRWLNCKISPIIPREPWRLEVSTCLTTIPKFSFGWAKMSQKRLRWKYPSRQQERLKQSTPREGIGWTISQSRSRSRAMSLKCLSQHSKVLGIPFRGQGLMTLQSMRVVVRAATIQKRKARI